MIETFLNQEEDNRNNILTIISKTFTKTSLVNFYVYFFKHTQLMIPGVVSPRYSHFFQASRYKQFLHEAFMVVARQRQGDTFQGVNPKQSGEALTSVKVTFASPISHRRHNRKKETSFYIHEYVVNRASMYTLYYVDIVGSSVSLAM